MRSVKTDMQVLLSTGLFIAAFAYLFWPAITGMVHDWDIDPNYSHGFLVPAISAYLAWQKRDQLAKLRATRCSLGLLVVIGGLLLFLVGMLAGESFTMRFSMLVVFGGGLLYALGWQAFKVIAFPYFFLFFMVPLPYLIYDSIAFPLKLLISKYSVITLKLLGVPVLREGNVIQLATTTLEVADACSGIRSLLSLLTLAAAMGYLFLDSWWRRVALLVLAVPTAMVANAFRVIGTGVLASYFGAGVAEGFFHEFAGLVIFMVSMVMLILLTLLLGRKKGRARHG